MLMDYTPYDKYKEIIDLSHPVSKKHPQMSMINRAAQFSPFAALTGHSDAIDETARLTDRRIELDESQIAELDGKLQIIAERISEHPCVAVTWFQPDEKKAGGAYVEKSGAVKKIDSYAREVVFMDGTRIQIMDIYAITGELFPDESFD